MINEQKEKIPLKQKIKQRLTLLMAVLKEETISVMKKREIRKQINMLEKERKERIRVLEIRASDLKKKKELNITCDEKEIKEKIKSLKKLIRRLRNKNLTKPKDWEMEGIPVKEMLRDLFNEVDKYSEKVYCEVEKEITNEKKRF